MVGKSAQQPIVATPFAYCFEGEPIESLLLFQTVQRASFFTVHGNLEFLKIVAQSTNQARNPIDVVFF